MKSRKVILILILTIVSVVNSYSQWVKLNTDSLHAYLDIEFLNQDTGFISGTYNPFDQDGVVLRTLNGGDNWDTTIISAGGWLMDIQFINDSVGFAGGQDGNLYITYDMGDTWTYYGNCQPLNDITNFYFWKVDSALILNVSSTLAMFDPPSCSNLLNNAGWTSFPGTGALDFITPQFGYLSGGYGSFIITSDGGSNWINFNCDTNMLILGATMVDTIKAIVVGEKGKVSVTNNGGSNWSSLDSISMYDILDVDLLNSNIGYCVGGQVAWSPNFDGNGTIWLTQDGGTTWSVDDSSYNNQLIDVLIVNDSLSFAVGYNGLLLRNQMNLGTVGTSQLPDIHNVNIYPIPFSNTLNIEFTKKEFVRPISLCIIDITGRNIYFEELTIAKTIQIDSHGWAEGIYFAIIESASFRSVKKLIRIK